MLKKNLFKNVTSAVLAMFFLFSSVTLVSFAALSKGKKSRNSNLTASDIMEAYDIATGNGIIDDCEYDHSIYYVKDNTSVTESNTYCRDDFEYDYSDYDGKPISPEEDHEYKKWEKSALNDNNYVTNFEEEEEEWNEPTKKGDEKVGNNVFTAGEENNNLNDNDDPSANAEEGSTQNGNTAINYSQNNLEPSQNASQRGNQGTVTPWHLIVFDDNNNE